MTPDPNTSAKVSRYKWEPYRDTNWWCIYYFLPRGRHTLQIWEVYRDTFQKISGSGVNVDSLEALIIPKDLHPSVAIQTAC